MKIVTLSGAYGLPDLVLGFRLLSVLSPGLYTSVGAVHSGRGIVLIGTIAALRV